MAERPVRKGVGFADRPTEWTTAIVFLITAIVAYANDRNFAALVSAAAIAVPIIVTGVTAWWEARHATAVDEVPTVG